MSGTPGVHPDDIAGLATAAAAIVAGIGASVASQRDADERQLGQLRMASELDRMETRLGPAARKLQDMQHKEMHDRFNEARLYSRLFLLMITLFAVIFLWGSVSLILGITAAHVVTILASAIPGVTSALFKHASNVAVQRSDEAFKELSKRIEDAEALDRREAALASVQELQVGDSLKTLEAIKSIVPNATPGELASIIKDLPAIAGRTATRPIQVRPGRRKSDKDTGE